MDDVIIIDSHDIARIRNEELDKLFVNGRGHASELKNHTRRYYGDDSLRGMPEQTRRQIKERIKAALVIAQEMAEFVDKFGLSDEEFESSSW